MSFPLSSLLAELRPLDAKAVYLFGSRAQGTARPGSDLDLALLPGRPLDPVELFLFANRLADKFGVEVDLIDLSKASTVMAKEVLRTGKRLETRDPTAAGTFEMLTLSSYARLNEERQPILNR